MHLQPASLAVLFLCGLAAADTAPAPPFAGTWQGTHNDVVFCVLKLSSGESVTGTMSVGQIETDDDGNLKSAGPATGDEYPLIKPRVDGEKLLFDWDDEPNGEPLKMEMTVVAPGEAELRFVSTPANVKIKPLKLRRKD